MSQLEIRDRLFDVFNETDCLPVVDIMVDEASDSIKLYLEDGTIVSVTCKVTGLWNIINVKK